jgi:hypothetical protein
VEGKKVKEERWKEGRKKIDKGEKEKVGRRMKERHSVATENRKKREMA